MSHQIPDETRARVDALIGGMTLAEKAGALLAARVTMNPDGTLWEGTPEQSPFGFVPTTEMILERHIGHLGLMNIPSVEALAGWGERIRELTARTRLRVPVSVGADPTHGRDRNVQVGQAGAGFSRITEPIGLAATWDASLVEEVATMMARELRAAGIHIAVHPMADLATEPRWARVAGTFGEDPQHAAETIRAFVRGLQSGGAEERVLATAKHFPGGGPQRDGFDAHFERGANTVYPGGRFEDHLAPFAAAIDEGVAMMMPGYAAPVGAPHEEVGFAFQRSVITGLLRERLGFDGVVVTDFNIVTGMALPRLGVELPVRAWGLLDVEPVERVGMLFAAGVDQLGGESDPQLILDAVDRGLVTEQRLDESVRRVLGDKARLGLLDDPAAGTVEPARIHERVHTAEHVSLARRAQRASIVAVHGTPVTVAPQTRVYSEGVDRDVLARYATPVETVEEAEIAVLRIDAPYEKRPAQSLESGFHEGSLEFPADEVDRIVGIAGRIPTLVDVFLDRAAVLTPFRESGIVALTGTFGVDDDLLLDAMTGRAETTGRLPFDLPRSDAAVIAAREDVPFDTADPLFRFGHGLSWGGSAEE
ncbi:beta-glucosidase [Microbacterium resistens]|uniref:beta-glucosidase n=1 Tax=Microbacterium resistens TaxID=156977 RepID=A0ABU1SGZ2_9MICO|nr:glycoside hydrolase family 3 N-terminal domain-containing protein [Microbacterium resistens]MDR6868132.1 beta-glucosidase [Microbacterium resistens]